MPDTRSCCSQSSHLWPFVFSFLSKICFYSSAASALLYHIYLHLRNWLLTSFALNTLLPPWILVFYLPPIFASWEITQNPVILNSAMCSCIFHAEFCKPPWCLYQLGKSSLWRKAYNFASEKRYKRHFVGHTSSTASPPFFSEFHKFWLLKTPKEN